MVERVSGLPRQLREERLAGALGDVNVNVHPLKAFSLIGQPITAGSSLHASRLGASACSNFLEIHRRVHYLHILKTELGSLAYERAIDRYERTAVVVQAISVTALLICVEIHTTQLRSEGEHAMRVSAMSLTSDISLGSFTHAHLERRFPDQLDPRIQLAQLVVACRSVEEDLHSVQALCDMRAEVR